MPEKPPFMPTGIGMGMITDDETKVGVLIFEKAQGNFDFALNLQAVDILSKAISKIELHLRADKVH